MSQGILASAEASRMRKAPSLRSLQPPAAGARVAALRAARRRVLRRFVGKEAGMKALGTGWRRGVRWVDLEVVREKSGRPTLKLAGEAEKIAKQLGVKHIALSITHTEEQALAQVIFEA